MPLWLDALLIVICALLIDRYVGEVSNRYHPLRWMGNLLDILDRHIINRESRWDVLWGFLGYVLVLLVFGGIGMLICALVRHMLIDVGIFTIGPLTISVGEIVWILVVALFFKVTFAIFAFRRYCAPVAGDLRRHDLGSASAKVQMMVNRQTKGMDLPHLTSSCCETISENLVDSIISPVFYFGFFGLLGAIAFRCSNLMDAMWGHLDKKYFVLGHFPARLDDALGYIPSRLSPIFVTLAAWLMRLHPRQSPLRAALAEHKKTPSPNSGWPMTATAAALGVSFHKEGVYVMGEGPYPSVDDIARCYHLIELTAIVFLLIITAPMAMIFGIHVQVFLEDLLWGLCGGL
ncbi:MAG: adenosylcobinamide-phosphate synthase CbiB [Candidatus Methanomethylophilus sp.]|nr:adenosylcobinamide-phosphate synthase CbiB [Methanomethylophilus sp.]MDD4222313.1 adenosylcobinamide-phosphate synthase CbiB [Methanomethylophilus sp.]MDD4668780.1 adenosylcobinamide-phosphate synthase CbiB [Methanomethylophilus sp.]